MISSPSDVQLPGARECDRLARIPGGQEDRQLVLEDLACRIRLLQVDVISSFARRTTTHLSSGDVDIETTAVVKRLRHPRVSASVRATSRVQPTPSLRSTFGV